MPTSSCGRSNRSSPSCAAPKTKDHQARGVALIGSALISIFFTIGGGVGRLYYDAIQQPEGSELLWLIPVVFIGVLIGCCCCPYATYRYL